MSQRYRAWDIQKQKFDTPFHCVGWGIYSDEKTKILTIPTPTDWILEESTGLEDSLAKEIFVGDIVRFRMPDSDETEVGEVIFANGTFKFRGFSLNWDNKREVIKLWDDGMFDHESIELVGSEDMEVLGNIHQNPEFIRKPESSGVKE